ncbi:phosphotransferase family protein [Mycobacterium asiaticum]|uniref:phosphotransferase family protein n=1 Tax=Mycobacterium asiaticum TaxID=1790 RepID=UPI00056C1DC5|nr:phosphotransferase family protein [Mycobacterium asiaticum]ORA12023.1 acyl-CoA dehydrogenase [Mycobacterium asiaticum DSM 44297]
MADLSDPLDRLRRRLGQIEGLRPLTGGASSLTYTGRWDGRPVVVKVAPAGIAPTGHRDVLRQSRLIAALAGGAVPVPEVLWEDPGEPPADPPLFVMSMLAGSSVEPLFDMDSTGLEETDVRERFRSAASTMAQLHLVRPSAIGLSAEPVITATAEVKRWCRTLETVDPTLAPGWREVGAALLGRVPAPLGPAVVHGDFRLGNVLAVANRITGVIDWEIWSVGDPRVDVGWFLINCDPETYRRPTRYVGGTPSLDELAGIYQTTVGFPVPGLGWFQALACFKSVATWSLIVKHNRRRPQPDCDLEAMSKALPHLLSRAGELLG